MADLPRKSTCTMSSALSSSRDLRMRASCASLFALVVPGAITGAPCSAACAASAVKDRTSSSFSKAPLSPGAGHAYKLATQTGHFNKTLRRLRCPVPICRISQHPHLALREGNGNTVFLKTVPKRQIHIAANIGQAPGRVAYPEPQDVIHAAVTKAHDMANRRLELQHPVHALGRLNGQRPHLMRIVAIGGAEIDIQPYVIVGMGPVDHLTRDQILVRNKVLPPIARGDRHVARPKAVDPAEGLAKADHIARLDRPIQQM